MEAREILGISVSAKAHGFEVVERAKRSLDPRESLARSGSSVRGLVLSTCSRHEVYLTGTEDEIENVAREISDKILTRTGAEPKILRGYRLAEHLVRVLSGAESPAPFELDISRQAERALREAISRGATDKSLYRLFSRSIGTGIEIRRRLGISGDVGIPELSVKIASEMLGGLKGLRVLVTGTGEVGKRILGALSREGVSEVTVVGRSLERAERASKIFEKAAPASVESLKPLLEKSDLAFLALSSPEPVVRARQIGTEGHGPEILVDLGMPRNVDTEASRILGKRYLWLEDLARASPKIVPQLWAKVREFEEILWDHVVEIAELIVLERVTASLDLYARSAETIRRAEIARAVKAFGLDEKAGSVLDLVTASISNKILGLLRSSISPRAPGDRLGRG